MTCIGKDPRCPCQDGDACHYKDCGGTKAWPVPQAEPVSCRFCHDKKGCWAWQCYKCGEIDDVQQPAAQPVQEPVAWAVQGCSKMWRGEFAEIDAKAEAKRIGGTCVAFALYTEPPQRKPLTDVEIKDCLDAADQMYCERDGDKELFKARTVLAAHGIKEKT